MSAPTDLHSNATNFASYVQSGVDPRTGLYTVSFSLPEVKTCDLSGPVVPLQMGYSPLNTLDNGYGIGWSMALTEYQPSNQIIALYSGESFKVTGNYADEGEPARLKMKEQKIPTFKLYQLTNDPRGDFMVAHADGLVEILKLTGSTPQVAMPVKLYSPQGHEVTLAYQNFAKGRMLSTVRDSQGLLLEVIRNLTANTVEIRLKPVQGVPLAVFTLYMESNQLTRVSLPTANGAGWRFLYGTERQQLCIKEVWTPQGAHEIIQYNDGGHGFPGNPWFANLPRVTDHVTEPGAGQPPVVVNYTYSDNGNNFLGRNAPIDWSNDEDNLYKVLGEYLYETTERLMDGTHAVRTITRTFNRFHLMTSQVTLQGNCLKSHTITYYANDTDTFENQDPRCQLAREANELWYLTDDPRFWRLDRKVSEYDIHGNLTKTVHANGITEEMVYFPAEGVPSECPEDPYGFVRHLREKTVIPASDPTLVPDLQSGAVTLRTRYIYESMSPITGGSKPWVALIEQRLLQVRESSEHLLQKSLYTYINEPGNPLTHGRRQQQAVTFGETTAHTTFTRYTYSKHAATYATFAGETVLRTVEELTTDFDAVSKSITHERSLLNGEPLLVNDKDEEMRYTYDALGRVVKEEQAPNSPYPASRTFTYRLIRPAGQGETPVTDLAGQEMEDVKGVRIRTWMDGLGRTVKEERQDLDNAGGSPPVFRTTYEANYDPFNQMTDDTAIDWMEKTDLRLTNTYTYDLWGQQDSVTGADGIQRHNRANPINFTTEQWVEGMGKSVTVSNRFDKTVKAEQYDLSGKRLSLHRYKYDGLGHCTEEIDALGYINLFRYDVHGRLLSNTLPDRTVITNTYAPQTAKALPTAITVQPGNILLPPKTLGTQAFDGLERLTRVTVGGRVEQLQYEGGRMQACRRVTPAGKNIDFEYKPGLTQRPTAIKPPEGDATFEYDLLNGNLENSSNARGTYTFTYSHTGHLSGESWKEPTNPEPWVTRYTSSSKGRLLRRTDVGKQTTEADYDLTNGRMTALRQNQLQAAFEYDNCGRLFRTTNKDLGSGNTLTTTLAFDDVGREIERTLALRDSQNQPLQPVRSIELNYLADGNVRTRHLRVDGKTALLESFEYDLRGRLEVYRCSGDELPRDRFGNAIIRQHFEFDALDNVFYSRTDFADGSHNVAEYGFSDVDPCQMIKTTHSHADYRGLASDFTYDADGNLEYDEMGQQLHYDSLGRLMSVSSPGGQPVTGYDYDAHDLLVAVKPEGQPRTLRFYEGMRLSDTMQDGQHTQLLHCDGQPLGQQSPGDDSQTLLLLTDAKHSVIAESQGDELRSAVYSPYGDISGDAPLKSLQAFNGEIRDPVSGWYLLGRGYRAYDPYQMCFFNPDPASPFGAGGINCYKYCSGNPIAFTDPSGRTGQGQVIHNPWFGFGVAAGTTIFGVVASLITFNPGPLAAALNLSIPTTVGTGLMSAATVVSGSVGISTSGATFVGSAAAFTSGAASGYFLGTTLTTSVLGFGVDGSTMFVRDETAAGNLLYVGLGIGAIAFLSPKTFKPPMPKLTKGAGSLRKASSGSESWMLSDSTLLDESRFTFEQRVTSGADYELDAMSGKAKGVNWIKKLDNPTFSRAHHISQPIHKIGTASSKLGTILEEGYGVAYAGSQSLTPSSAPAPAAAAVESFQLTEVNPRTQEWLGAGIRQSSHKPNRTFGNLDDLV